MILPAQAACGTETAAETQELPAIPADVPAAYPYTLLFHGEQTGEVAVNAFVLLTASTAEWCFHSQQNNLISRGELYVAMYYGGQWVDLSSQVTPEPLQFVDLLHDTLQVALLDSSHDIYYAENADYAAGTYTRTDVLYFAANPETVLYQFRHSTMVGLADEARRLGNVTGKLTTAQMKAIFSGLTPGELPSAAATAFGREPVVEPYQVPTGKTYYNGLLLPDPPADVIAQYPYCFLRENLADGYYDLLFSSGPFWRNSAGEIHTAKNANAPHYRIPLSGAATAGSWTFKVMDYWYGEDAERILLWSNHDILNGSETATDVYFAGTDAVPQTETHYHYGYGDFVTGAGSSAVSNETLNELAHRIQQRHSPVHEVFTGAQLADYVNRCDFCEKGTAGSAISAGSFGFTSQAYMKS